MMLTRNGNGKSASRTNAARNLGIEDVTANATLSPANSTEMTVPLVLTHGAIAQLPSTARKCSWTMNVMRNAIMRNVFLMEETANPWWSLASKN